MPVSYAGTVSEHNATRNAVGLFDVSHPGKALVKGPGAADFVNSVLTNDLRRIGPGKAQYTLCCTETGGGDRRSDRLLRLRRRDLLVPNAANTAAVVAAMKRLPAGHYDHRRAPFVCGGAGGAGTQVGRGAHRAGPADRDGLYGLRGRRIRRRPGPVCRTGYTGEHGYELLPPWDAAGVVFDALAAAVKQAGGEPAGLGARDTLRTEMGYPLHGHELSLDITPLQARTGWAVGWKKDAFWGRDALLAEKQAGPRRTCAAWAIGRGVLRADLTVLDGDTPVGVTTSGTFSPTLKVGIALALIDTAPASGTARGGRRRSRPADRMRGGRTPFVTAKPVSARL